MIEHLDYVSIKIITSIQSIASIKRKIRINLLPTKLKIPMEE